MFLLVTGVLDAVDTRQYFVEALAFDFRAVLSGPPGPDSADTRHEVEIALEVQATRTPADEVRIAREGKWSPFLFDDVLGFWFAERNLPETAALLDAVGRDTMEICEALKKR